MQKVLILIVVIVCAHAGALGMKLQPKQAPISNCFIKYDVIIPDIFKVDSSLCMEKKAFMHVPAAIAAKQASDKIAFKAYEAEGQKSLAEVVKVCISLLYNNDQGWVYPNNPSTLRYINPELLMLLKMQQTYLVFAKETSSLIVRWDLGEHTDGWTFDEVMEIKYAPKHPRGGSCSLLTVQYAHKGRKICGKVPVQTLRDMFAQAGKKTIITPENIDQLRETLPEAELHAKQADDLIAMALHYVTNPDNVKNLMQIPDSNE